MVHGWQNQEWFPELIDLMIDFPLALSLVQKLLRQTFSQHFHPHSWNLNLHACRSSKDSPIFTPPPQTVTQTPTVIPMHFSPWTFALHIIFVYNLEITADIAFYVKLADYFFA